MNYLAHIFLSGNDRGVQIGNFIGDAVKGRSYELYPEAIRRGILLHRAIDRFTDDHHLVRATVQSLKPYFGRYSAIILDMFFDYMLASRFDDFSDMPLGKFSRHFYWALIANRRHLPHRIKRFMWHFIATDRLSKYANKEGIRRSLEIMVAYKHIRISPLKAVEYLDGHEEHLRNIFNEFFKELQAYVTVLCQTD
jgi:acyl carrier protein phosphodiesterase